jgi:hypothetical protein
MGAEEIRVKSFTYRKSSFGIYRKQELLDLQKINDHIAQMLWLGNSGSDGSQLRTNNTSPFLQTRHIYFLKELKLGSSTSAISSRVAQIADQGSSSAEVTTR